MPCSPENRAIDPQSLRSGWYGPRDDSEGNDPGRESRTVRTSQCRLGGSNCALCARRRVGIWPDNQLHFLSRSTLLYLADAIKACTLKYFCAFRLSQWSGESLSRNVASGHRIKGYRIKNDTAFHR